jgi:exonuclease SbcC
VLRARDTALAPTLELARHAKTACGRYINANEVLTKARAAEAAATDTCRAACLRLDQAERDHATHSAARAEIGALADLADQTLSLEAIHLRSLLLPGEACPVCGSTEPPHFEADDALIGIVNQMRRRREALDDALRSAGSAMTGARGAIAQAKGEIAAASLAAQTAESDRQVAIDTYMALRPQLENALLQAGIDPQVPDELDESVNASLDAVVTSGEIARDATAGPLAEAERLRGEIDRLQSELDSHISSIEDVGRVLGDHSSTLHDAEIAHAEHRATSIGLKDRLASITRELEPFLSAINLTSTDLDRDPEYIRHHMQQTGAAYLKLSARQLDLERELQALVPRRASALSTNQGAMAAKAMAQVDLEERQASLRMKHEARAALLDGEATGSHRTRVNEARKAARTERHAAREAQATAATTAASAEAHAQAAISAVGAARERARAASAEFLSGCADLGLRPEQVRELLAVSDDVRGTLRVRLDNLASALRIAETELATRRADHAALLEASSGEIDLGTMRERERQPLRQRSVSSSSVSELSELKSSGTTRPVARLLTLPLRSRPPRRTSLRGRL